MRISDWSSDVCSSDLSGADDAGGLTPLTLAMLRKGGGSLPPGAVANADPLLLHGIASLPGADQALRADAVERLAEIGALPGGRLAGAYDALDRKSTRLNSSH